MMHVWHGSKAVGRTPISGCSWLWFSGITMVTIFVHKLGHGARITSYNIASWSNPHTTICACKANMAKKKSARWGGMSARLTLDTSQKHLKTINIYESIIFKHMVETAWKNLEHIPWSYFKYQRLATHHEAIIHPPFTPPLTHQWPTTDTPLSYSWPVTDTWPFGVAGSFNWNHRGISWGKPHKNLITSC